MSNKFLLEFHGERVEIRYAKDKLHVKIASHKMIYDKNITMESLLIDLEDFLGVEDEFVFEPRG